MLNAEMSSEDKIHFITRHACFWIASEGLTQVNATVKRMVKLYPNKNGIGQQIETRNAREKAECQNVVWWQMEKRGGCRGMAIERGY